MSNRMLRSLHLVRRNPLAVVGLSGVLLIGVVAVFAPMIAPSPHDAIETHIAKRFIPPCLGHPFGTDELGRDVFSRVLLGARISVRSAILALSLVLAIGVPLGAIAGYTGGVLGEVIMRTTDVFLSFPPLLLALAISAMLGPSLSNALIAIAMAWWPWYTRILRSAAMSVREREFIQSAKAIGASNWRIVFRHVLPNCLPPIVVQASMDFGSIVLTLASLSYLGLGAQPPAPEWGLMVSTGRTFFLTKWWIVAFPGLAIFASALSFNLTGDGLTEIMDPRWRRLRG